jgi:adenosine deaminase
VNSDDPAYFGGYVGQNFSRTFEALDLGADAAVTLARNSFEAAFVEPAARARHLERLEAYVEAFR